MFGISFMTTDNFCFYLPNRLFQTSQTGGHPPLVFPAGGNLKVVWTEFSNVSWSVSVISGIALRSRNLRFHCKLECLSKLACLCQTIYTHASIRESLGMNNLPLSDNLAYSVHSWITVVKSFIAYGGLYFNTFYDRNCFCIVESH